MKVLHTVDNIKRETIIPYKIKSDNKFLNENTILFKIPYDFNIIHNKELLNNV